MVNDTRDDMSKVVPGQVKPEPRRCVVELKNGEKFSCDLSASTLKLIRRSNGKLPLRNPADGSVRTVEGREIRSISRE